MFPGFRGPLVMPKLLQVPRAFQGSVSKAPHERLAGAQRSKGPVEGAHSRPRPPGASLEIRKEEDTGKAPTV